MGLCIIFIILYIIAFLYRKHHVSLVNKLKQLNCVGSQQHKMRKLNTSHHSATNYYLLLVSSVFKCALVNTVQLETIVAKIIE